MPLRDYQEKSIESLFAYFARRQGDPLVVLPTGAGKSVVQAEFVSRAIEQYPSTRFVCVTHVKELIDQNAKALIKWAPHLSTKVGINSAGLKQRDTASQVLFCGIQSVHRKTDKIGHVDLLLVDEAHLIPHSGHGMYRRFIDNLRDINPHMKLIGFTATPYRTGSGMLTKGKGKLFSSVCHNVRVEDLIDKGYLSDLTTTQGNATYDTNGIRLRGGEYMQSDLGRVLEDSHDITRLAVEQTIDEGENRRAWLVFCGSVGHAEEATQLFKERGVAVEMITGNTDRVTRDRIIGDFKADRLKCIVNVNVLTTGFDVPHVDLITLMRPTQSPGLYVQMIGRGMRIAEGKSDCLVIDFGANLDRHGPLNNIRMPAAPKGDGEGVTKSCPQCFYEGIPAGSLECPECGYHFPPREVELAMSRSTGKLIQRTNRDWVLITDVTYARHRKKGKPDSLKVTYWGGMNQVAHQWVCIEHEGFAREKALSWLVARIGEDDFPPLTVEAAIEMGKAGRFKEPEAILIDKAGQYPEVLSHSYDGIPEAGRATKEKVPSGDLTIDLSTDSGDNDGDNDDAKAKDGDASDGSDQLLLPVL